MNTCGPITPQQIEDFEARSHDEHGPDVPEQRGGSVVLKVQLPPGRRYLPTLSDLVDRLTIVQQKMIFISERADEYRAERADILHDIDLILKDHPPLSARAIWAITLIQLTNRCIWESESKARAGGNEQDKLLKLTHSINGQRNTAKNVLAEEMGGRKDYKVDALSAELPPEYGHWDIF